LLGLPRLARGAEPVQQRLRDGSAILLYGEVSAGLAVGGPLAVGGRPGFVVQILLTGGGGQADARPIADSACGTVSSVARTEARCELSVGLFW